MSDVRQCYDVKHRSFFIPVDGTSHAMSLASWQVYVGCF